VDIELFLHYPLLQSYRKKGKLVVFGSYGHYTFSVPVTVMSNGCDPISGSAVITSFTRICPTHRSVGGDGLMPKN
jgi:hypothetical protein